jgi:HlyD family secretion protein
MTPNLRRLLLWSALGLAVAAALVWSFWPEAVPVETVPVTRGAMAVEVSDEGRTRVREVYQLAAPVGGRLLRIEKHAGDAVTGGETVVGDLLPTAPSFLDVRSRAQAESAVKSAQAALSLAAAEVRRAKAELDFAVSDLRRAQALAKSDAVSQSTLERAQLTRNTAAAQLATADAARRAKEFDLEAAKALLIDPQDASAAERQRSSIPLIAPVSGRILRVLHESETVVPAGTAILEIGNPQSLEIVVEFISEDAVKIHTGDAATITDWGGNVPLPARVRRVEPSGFTKTSALGVEEQRVNVLLDFVDPPSRRPAIADGFRVVAHVVIWRKPDVVQVPLSATFRAGKGWAAFAVRNGRAVLTPVEIGKSNDEFAQVLGGLNPKDRVIVHPSDRVRDGVGVAERVD